MHWSKWPKWSCLKIDSSMIIKKIEFIHGWLKQLPWRNKHVILSWTSCIVSGDTWLCINILLIVFRWKSSNALHDLLDVRKRILNSTHPGCRLPVCLWCNAGIHLPCLLAVQEKVPRFNDHDGLNTVGSRFTDVTAAYVPQPLCIIYSCLYSSTWSRTR